LITVLLTDTIKANSPVFQEKSMSTDLTEPF
jgi:hypothetical protein